MTVESVSTRTGCFVPVFPGSHVVIEGESKVQPVSNLSVAVCVRLCIGHVFLIIRVVRCIVLLAS
jgi:hypothetical protein